MSDWAFYPVLIGTLLSVVGLSRIAIQNHFDHTPKSLSELAAAEGRLLKRFRNILIFCDALFAITLFGFIVPRVDQAVLVAIFGGLMIGGEFLAALLPARGRTLLLHLVFAQTMSVGMLGLGVLFLVTLAGWFSILAAVMTACMVIFGLLTIVDKKHYITYELAFIFSSHFSIIVAAVALK